MSSKKKTTKAKVVKKKPTKATTKKKPEAKKPEEKKPTKKEEEPKKEEFKSGVINFSRKDFRLKGLKLLKDNRGVEINYFLIKHDGSLTNEEKTKTDSPIIPHDDLVDSVLQLGSYAVKAAGLVKAIKILGLDGTDRSTLLGQIVNDFDVRSIAISGEEDSKRVIISGVFTCFNNFKTNINTPLIPLAQSNFEFESDLTDVVNEIEDEAYKFIYEGKKAPFELIEGEPKKMNKNQMRIDDENNEIPEVNEDIPDLEEMEDLE